MKRQVSVRLDNESFSALTVLEANGLTRSEAIRSSLVYAAARMLDKQTLAVEAAAVEANEGDQAEMRAVARMMEELRAPW